MIWVVTVYFGCTLSREAQNERIRLSDSGKVVDISERDNIVYISFERSSINGVKVLPFDLRKFPEAYIGMPVKIFSNQPSESEYQPVAGTHNR